MLSRYQNRGSQILNGKFPDHITVLLKGFFKYDIYGNWQIKQLIYSILDHAR